MQVLSFRDIVALLMCKYVQLDKILDCEVIEANLISIYITFFVVDHVYMWWFPAFSEFTSKITGFSMWVKHVLLFLVVFTLFVFCRYRCY